jgi:hypothetical protein
MTEINELIDYYLTSKVVFTQEEVFNKLVLLSSENNYKKIISKLENYSNDTEIETTIYLIEIANKKFIGFKEILQEKLKTYTNKDAIENLNEALDLFNR